MTIVVRIGLAPSQSSQSSSTAQDTTTLQHRNHRPTRSLNIMSEDNYHNRISKFIAAGKSNRVIIGGIIAKVNLHKFCDCPNREPGKIRADIGAHLPDCPIRERLQSGRYTVDTSVTPNKFNDGYSLGVALGQEDC